MISVDEALAQVLALAKPVATEDVALADAVGRVLAVNAVARLTQPPFDAAAMDGYALRDADLPGPLVIVGESAAGRAWDGTLSPGQAVRIFTGAPVPAGADRVVMQENTTRNGDQITVTDPSGKPHIRPRGNDFSAGECLPAGRHLRAADVALLAAMNVAVVTVARPPRVAILAGGDELVLPGEIPGPGQIISSNDLAIAALARATGADVRVLPLARDTHQSLSTAFAQAEGCDILVTIGGASVGDHDLIATVSQDRGVELNFHKIAMRPGKPLMAGQLGRSVMLGLPGNPVSAMVCGILFLQPLIRAMQGDLRPIPRQAARLTVDLPPEGNRQHYLRARTIAAPDGLRVEPFADQDSARLRIMADADCLIERPAHDPARKAGDLVSVISLPD